MWAGVGLGGAVGELPIRGLGTEAEGEGPRAQEDPSLEGLPQLSL